MSGRPSIIDLHIAGVGAATLIRTGSDRVVYRAAHEIRGVDVVIEIMAGSHGEAARERFTREQQAMGRLAGVEGVVALLEAGVTIEGRLYLMTPFVDGRSLADHLADDGAMAWDRAAGIVEDLAYTVQHAHVVGVTHRSIDPTVVLITDARPMLSGLGTAGLTMDAAGTDVRTSALPGYRAPEADHDPAAAADVYALGALLWALIAGRAPFTFPEGGDDPDAVAARALDNRVGDLRSVAPEPVVEAIEWATAADPALRPSSAATFARALRDADSRAPSGFVADLDAIIDGWRPRTSDGFEPSENAPPAVGVSQPLAAMPIATPAIFDRDVTRDASAATPAPAAMGSTRPAALPDNDDGRRAGLLVGAGIAAIALVALCASALLVLFAGDERPVTVTGPQIEAADTSGVGDTAGASAVDEPEVLGLEIEAPAFGDGATSTGGPVTAPRTDQSAPIAPFAIPTPTPTPGGATSPGRPTAAPQPTATARPTVTARPTPTAAPEAVISAPAPPEPTPTVTPETTISAPAPPPVPTSGPTATPTRGPVPTATPAPTAVPARPTPSSVPVVVPETER